GTRRRGCGTGIGGNSRAKLLKTGAVGCRIMKTATRGTEAPPGAGPVLDAEPSTKPTGRRGLSGQRDRRRPARRRRPRAEVRPLGGSLVNAAFLLVTTAWIAGADTAAPAAPTTPPPAAAAVHSVGTGGCASCGGCTTGCDTCCEHESLFSKLK